MFLANSEALYSLKEKMLTEQHARAEIDRLLAAAGWLVQDVKAADIHAGRGVARREFQFKQGHGFADYLL